MAKTRDITLIGDRKLAKKFERLASKAAQNRVIRRPLSSALTPNNKEAKRLVPVGATKGLKKSIGKKVKAYPGGVWGGVGPRTGAQFITIDAQGRKNVPANYAHLVEFGTIRTRAQPFLRPALDKKRGQANQILKSGISKNLMKEATRK